MFQVIWKMVENMRKTFAQFFNYIFYQLQRKVKSENKKHSFIYTFKIVWNIRNDIADRFRCLREIT